MLYFLTKAIFADTIIPMTETNVPRTRTTRTRKTTSPERVLPETPSSASPSLKLISEIFLALLEKINKAREEFETLEKEIARTKEEWEKEKRHYEKEKAELKAEEELARKRDEQTYEYETALVRKRAEDEFSDKKAKWEKELTARKEEIEKDKRELEALRKEAAAFENEKGKAVKEACDLLEKDITGKFDTERRLREQGFKAEREISSLRIETLTKENVKQANEIETLRKALEEATRQIKEIAVKVIETGGGKSVSFEGIQKT